MCKRCKWGISNELMMEYHDTEWGVPLHDDNKLFEFIALECFQAGLSWQIVLNKRDAFRKTFENFDPEKVARFNEEKIAVLLQNKFIIRNKRKIEACINNARHFLDIQKEYGSFDKYIWNFVDYKPIINSFADSKALPAKTPLSDSIAADLRKKGFAFVGSTVVYAYMQATGMVNDHIITCYRYNEINSIGR